jgi:hypothetical protein
LTEAPSKLAQIKLGKLYLFGFNLSKFRLNLSKAFLIAHMSDIKQVRWMSSKSRAVSALEQNLKAVAGHLEHNSVSGTRADDANRGK